MNSQDTVIAMKATASIITDFNDGHYTAWLIRRQHLHRRNDLLQELQFVRELAVEQPKNYQLWYHRQWILHRLDDPMDEPKQLTFLAQDDQKNYHGWQYRQWLVRRFKLDLQEELDLTGRLLKEDPWNNSAWNHRVFILTLSCGDKASEWDFANQFDGASNESVQAYKDFLRLQ